MAIIPILAWTLVLSCCWADEPSLDPLDSGAGVLFQPQTTAVFSATTWYLAFEIDLREVEAEIGKIEELFQKEQNLTKTTFKNVKMRDQYFISNATVTQAIQQMQSEKKQLYTRLRGALGNQTRLQQRKKKRSLFPFIGRIYNFLYGTSTDDDYLHLQGQVDQLFTKQDRIVSLQKSYLTTFKRIDNQLQRQQQQLQQEVNLTHALFELLTGLRAEKDSNLQPIFHFVWQKELLTAIGEVRESFRDYNQALNHMQMGHLSLNLLPPEQLQMALANIQQHLPNHLSLALAAGDPDVLRYYQLPLTRQIPSQGTIRGMVNVPLVNAGQLFNIYKAIPFPTYYPEPNHIPEKQRFIWKSVPRYIAVTTDHSQFMDLGEYFSSDVCIKNDPQICPAQRQVTEESQDHCLYQLITGRMEVKTVKGQCEFEPYENQDPVIQAITDKLWAISVVESMNLRINCLNPENPSQALRALPNLKVTSDHWLRLPRHCTAILGSKTIPLRLKLHTNLSTNTPHYMSTADTEQLLNWYQDSIQDNHDRDQMMQDLMKKHRETKDNLDPDTQLKDSLDIMTDQLEDLSKREPTKQIHHIYGTLWGILSLVGLGYCAYQGYFWWRKHFEGRIIINPTTEVQAKPEFLSLQEANTKGSSVSVYREV
jgi:hypothetical protein